MNEPASPKQSVYFNFLDDATEMLKISCFVSGTCYTFTCEHQKFFSFKVVDTVKPAGYTEFLAAGTQFFDFIQKCFIIRPGAAPQVASSFRSYFHHSRTER